MAHFFAHSANTGGSWHPLREHLSAVGDLAESFFTRTTPWRSEARLAGLLHDLGKYGDLFQARLRGEESGLDHWSAGARLALENRAAAAALAIEGHHIGLQSLSREALGRLPNPCLSGLRLTAELPTLKERLVQDGIAISPPDQTQLGPNLQATVPSMLDVRLIFSALVDADYLDTEAHFEGDAAGKRYRAPGPRLQAASALDAVLRRIEDTRKESAASPEVRAVRDALLTACLSEADREPGLFTLTAPTGSGKTLAMLAFALRHAARHGLERVIMVIPYLTITEQTARVYRDILAPAFGEEFVLEHHSLAGTGEERFRQDGEDAAGQAGHAERRRRLLAENWDAPLIVTTSVQLLESLFSNRPAACRKLHRLQKSVILFDEAQTLPAGIAVPTLAALSHLSATWNSSVVFATATQPAFAHLHAAVTQAKASGWQPREIVPEPAALFAPMKRVDVKWGSPDDPLSWDGVAGRLASVRQALCIVNLKRDAHSLWEKLGDSGALHLSTNLCAAHRQDVLAQVRDGLANGQPVRLVATQCVEAGVDVDFPFVMRAWGPLDALIQAAGRCNREGRLVGQGALQVFQPEEAGYPPGGYEQATQVAQMLFRRHGAEGMRIDDPAFITAYYRELYDIAGTANSSESKAIFAAIEAGDFPEVARLYRIIKQDAINVLVPYSPRQALFDELAAEAESRGLSGAWIRRARPLAVSLYRPREDDAIWDALLPVPLAGRRQRENNDWFIYAVPVHYHPQLGLVPPGRLNVWIA
ncbi:MAG: CRISPR-associated helicase/endonuclease Cas3 [Rhodocyclales bacterium]|nr:MAG: CRISPR-associated helicase/endonuclease Cas3 [Rhodocyclales bacterium]